VAKGLGRRGHIASHWPEEKKREKMSFQRAIRGLFAATLSSLMTFEALLQALRERS